MGRRESEGWGEKIEVQGEEEEREERITIFCPYIVMR